METVLKKERFAEWVTNLANDAQVFGPAFADGIWNFAGAGGAQPIELDHTNTVRPPKGYVMPQREVLFRFRNEPGRPPQIVPTVPKAEPVVVFGVRPCDGRAMLRNDKVFSCGAADPYYDVRRENVVFVGLACNEPPSPNCFCKAVGGSPSSEDGLDVLMTELAGRYHVKALSEKGKAVVAKANGLFAPAAAADSQAAAAAHEAAAKLPQRSLAGVQEIAAGLKKNFESPKWEELGEACLGCGACTYLCPSCHCFDITDEMTAISPPSGERVRTWDNCQFADFTMHTSGHNPRESTGTRLRQRVAHKLLYFVENHGIQQCTGCGRCITHCPVGIDIVRVATEVATA